MQKYTMIVGANRNVGLAAARKFAQHGENLVITGRNSEQINQIAEELKKEYAVDVIARTFSQSEPETILPLYESLDDVLINRLVLNAANMGTGKPALEAEPEAWLDVIHTNLYGGFLMAREAARRLIAAGERGSVLFVGSNTSRRAIPNRSDYISSKGGLCALAKALAVEWGEHGIRVNILMPGSIHTDRWDELDEATLRLRYNRSPLRRVATCEEVAAFAYFLSSDESANTTGGEFVCDAGADALLFKM